MAMEPGLEHMLRVKVLTEVLEWAAQKAYHRSYSKQRGNWCWGI